MSMPIPPSHGGDAVASRAPSQPMNQTTVPSFGKGQLLSRAEAAEWLGLSISTLHRFVRRGLVPVHRLCRRLQFHPADLQDFIRAHRLDTRSPHHYGDPKNEG